MGNLEECKERIEEKRMKTGNKLIFRVGDKVVIYDRFRFAIPLLGHIVDFSEKTDSVEVKLLASNNTAYPVGSKVWVFKNQVKEAPTDSSYIESLRKRVERIKEESRLQRKEQEEKERQFNAMEATRRQQEAMFRGFSAFQHQGAAMMQHPDAFRLAELENNLFNQRSRITDLERKTDTLIESLCKIFDELKM